MDRKEFLRSSCGLCGCAALALLPAAAVGADQQNEMAEQQRRRLDAIFNRVAWLTEAMDKTLDEPTRARLLESVGRRCAQESASGLIAKHRGNIEGLCRELESLWVERAEYDPERGVIHHTSRKRDACGCPLVKRPPFASESLCHCTRGFQKEMYGQVSGRPVEVRIEGSVLRGGDRCRFTVQLL